ncbi:winged helix-turn-helix transcriptional regulator [Halobaculum sp. MBLA0147]|uniref:winged helix-turn-helix transcriptional regulator n=1 Tax=Halobaculum sp. MBLA0147 TaxID=3079934 RepID=UPI003525C8F1
MSREVDDEKRTTLRRFAALGAASPLAAAEVDAEESADGREARSDVRDAIRGYLGRTPGAHFSKLRDDLRLGTGETQHHLRRLESDGAVVSRRDGDYRRFYPADRFSAFEQTALGYLRRETARGILLTLLRETDPTGADVARTLDVSRATVSKYTSELEAAGLVDRSDGYAVRRPAVVVTLVVRYADSFGPDAVAFADEAPRLLSYDG